MSLHPMTISFSATGMDAPGLVATITQTILRLEGNILDVEETCRRGLFSIFLIIDFSASALPSETLLAQLKDLEQETGLKVAVDMVDPDAMALLADQEPHLVTVLGEDRPGIIAHVSRFFHERSINIEACRMIARGAFFSMEMKVDTSRMSSSGHLSHARALEKMKADLKDLCGSLGQGVVIQSEDIHNKQKRLIVFDVESTLLRDFSLTEFLKTAGSLPGFDIAGPLPLEKHDRESLLEAARNLKGLSAADLQPLGRRLTLHPGSIELIGVLKSMGFKIALLSSSFDLLVEHIFKAAGVDYAFSNTLERDEQGKMTGRLRDPVITSASKEEILNVILQVEGLHRDQIIAVGNGPDRSLFLQNAGLSIAFNPKPFSVGTDGVLGGEHILRLLYCLGIPKSELDRALLRLHETCGNLKQAP